jgi:hypothetical protein
MFISFELSCGPYQDYELSCLKLMIATVLKALDVVPIVVRLCYDVHCVCVCARASVCMKMPNICVRVCACVHALCVLVYI